MELRASKKQYIVFLKINLICMKRLDSIRKRNLGRTHSRLLQHCDWNLKHVESRPVCARRATTPLAKEILGSGEKQILVQARLRYKTGFDWFYFTQTVSEAAGQGVTITGDVHRNTWDWANSVIFASTIVTTIGLHELFWFACSLR